VQSGR